MYVVCSLLKSFHIILTEKHKQFLNIFPLFTKDPSGSIYFENKRKDKQAKNKCKSLKLSGKSSLKQNIAL